MAYLNKANISILHLTSKLNLQALALAMVFSALASFISIHLLFDSYKASALDLGYFTQALKYTLEGHPMYTTIGGLSLLAYHFSPIMFLLVPIYWVAPYCQTLLVVQAFAFGLAGYLVYYLAKSFKLSHRFSIFIELIFFLNPLVWGAILFDFHEMALAVPALLVMFIGMHQKRWLLFSIGLVLSLMTKEDLVLTLGVFGMGLLIANYLKSKRLNYSALIILCSALFTYGIAIFVSVIASHGESPRILTYFTARYAYMNMPLGQAIPGAISTIASSKSWLLILEYLAPLGFLPLFSIPWVMPVLFNLAQNMFSTNIGQQHGLNQSSTVAVPFMFMAMIMFISKLEERNELHSLLVKFGRNLPVLIVILVVLISLKYQQQYLHQSSTVAIAFLLMVMVLIIANRKHPPVVLGILLVVISLIVDFRPTGRIKDITWPGPHEKAINQVIGMIPEGATVTANNSIFPHLVTRTVTYLPLYQDIGTPIANTAKWGFPYRDTEYVVIDRYYLQPTIPNGHWEDTVKDDLDQRYTVIAEKDGASVYRLR